MFTRIPTVPVWAEMVLGELFSGWAWEHEEGERRFVLLYRLPHGSAFGQRYFKSWDDLNQFCDGLEGDTDEFIRN